MDYVCKPIDNLVFPKTKANFHINHVNLAKAVFFYISKPEPTAANMSNLAIL